MNNFIFIISIFSILSSQNIDLYFSLIDEGELDGVKENLPELLSKYPNDPGVLFLKAILTTDGESAINQYKYILENFTNSTSVCSSISRCASDIRTRQPNGLKRLLSAPERS